MNLPRTWWLVLVGCAACAEGPPPAAPASTPPPSTAQGPTAAVASSAPAPPPPPTNVTEALASHRTALDACYAQARSANPALGRTSVEMTFTIDAEGKPLTVDLQYKHRMDDRAKECLRDAALAQRFPPSMQGKQTGSIAFSPAGP